MNVPWKEITLEIPTGEGKLRIMEAIPNQIVTGRGEVEPTLSQGEVVADPGRDLLKIAVVERHTGSGRVGLGLVRGMGLKEGAIAGTVAHDHHNLVAIGADDASMLAALRKVGSLGGGLAVAREGRAIAALPLPVGGLMSLDPIQKVREGLEGVLDAARKLGTPLHDPFMAMSFLALEVIPTLKITDRGLVDVDLFQPVDLWTGPGG
jgi:adenine deaminase